MITIDQLLESVDVEFEPRWVTKDKNGTITVWLDKPELCISEWVWVAQTDFYVLYKLKLSEFSDKDWQECIYEVQRKTTGKIKKIEVEYKDSFKIKDWQDIARTVENKINELVDAINELKGE